MTDEATPVAAKHRPRKPAGPDRVAVTLSLPAGTIDRVDELADAWGMNRSHFVARLITEALDQVQPAPPSLLR